MILNSLAPGSLGRWALGVIILTYLISYNESGCVSTLIALSIAMMNALFSVLCKNGLKNIQIPYLRASHRLDFLCLFLGLWMEILALLAVCAAFSRTISTCLDVMSGGLIRIYILGRNSPINEPWPDVLGVSVVFLVTAMFMMGLENTKIFSVLMISGVLLISGILSIATWLRGSEPWSSSDLLPDGIPGILSASAVFVIAFPNQISTSLKHPKIKSILFGLIVLISNLLIAGCLSTLMQINSHQQQNEYEAVPILSILEKKDLHKFISAAACLYVLACSGALLELFPETYSIIVRLATSEWKILVRQISYENRESGSPILAIFICGSLCAILAFACPLENLINIIAGCQLGAGILRALYFLYSPFRPKSSSHPQESSSLAYSRLSTEPKSNTVSKKRSFWFFNKAVNTVSSQNLNLSKSKSKIMKNSNDDEKEREWLLLGEPPSSPVSRTIESPIEESSIIADANSDVDCITKADGSESDSSTDIDAIVDEYRQKVKVSTAGLKDNNLRVPSSGSWKLAILCILSILAAATTSSIGALQLSLPMFLTGIIGSFIMMIIMYWIPKYSYTNDMPSIILCVTSLVFNCILISSTKIESWLAVSFWFLAGIIFFIRCDTWCCLCLDVRGTELSHMSDNMEQNLIPSASNSKVATTIRLQNPPKGTLVTQAHYQSRR